MKRNISAEGNSSLKRQIAKELQALLVEIGCCRLNQIRMSVNLREDLGIDSFTGLEILVAIEKRYGFRVSEREFNQIVTFEDIVGFVSKKLGKQ